MPVDFKYLRDILYGHQEHAIDKSEFHVFGGTFVETKSFDLWDSPVSVVNVDYASGLGVTNLKINGDFDTIELIIGGVRIETWKNGEPFLLEKTVVPLLRCQEMKFAVHHGRGTLSLDYVKLYNYDPMKQYRG